MAASRKYLKKAAIIFFVIGVIFIVSMNLLRDYIVEEYETYDIFITLIINSFVTISIWLGTATIVYFLWVKFPWEKEPLKHLILEIIALITWPTIVVLSTYAIFKNIVPGELVEGSKFGNIIIAIVITFLITAIHECVDFYHQWKEHFNKSVKLEKANLEAKYETLKTQINPHFLFNSLNTLITYVEENEVATTYIQNLSDFMRYVLKSREQEAVLLRDELDVAKKYAFLQESRFGKNLSIQFDIPEKYYHYSILPLSLQMLIENAIKHNIISKDKPLKINLYINSEKFIIIENNLQKKFDEPSTKLGLANITERYKFLSAKDVKISESSGKFTVALPLVIIDL
ncbi:sensor histidine kinase [Bacteroidota bacterium]